MSSTIDNYPRGFMINPSNKSPYHYNNKYVDTYEVKDLPSKFQNT